MCVGVKVAWSFAVGDTLDVDQASALLVLAVMASRLMVRAARECWAVHHEGQPSRAFLPDRYLGVFQYLFVFPAV